MWREQLIISLLRRTFAKIKALSFRFFPGILILTSLSAIAPQPSFADTAGNGACTQTFTKSDSGTVTVTESGGYCYVAFKNLGAVGSQATFSWTRPANVSVANILVVAGGGGGGSRHGGGGGAGGYIETSTYSISASSISIAVGAGGAGAGGGSSYNGGSGQSSYFKSGSNGLTAPGGGYGTYGDTPSTGGSSGSGGWSTTSPAITAGTTTTLSGTTLTGISFGNIGGTGANEGQGSYDYWAGGGGGGAGGAGKKPTSSGTEVTTLTDRTISVAGAGGIGKTPTWISPSIATSLGIGQINADTTAVYFAGGGGGGMGADGSAGGPGGLGGGATGTIYTPTALNTVGTANSGTAFTGGGGGGSGFDDISPAGQQNPPGGAGGSGVVVLRYAATYTVTYSYNSATGGNTTETATATTGGSAITLPTPTRTNYTFSGWYEASDFSGTALSTTYSPNQSITLHAKWTAQKVITVTQSSNGSISPSTTYVDSGANATFTLVPNAGYEVSSIIIDGASISTPSSPNLSSLRSAIIDGYTFSNITSDRSISATFSAIASTNLLLNLDTSKSSSLSVTTGTAPTWTSISPGATVSSTGSSVSQVSTNSTTSPNLPKSVYLNNAGSGSVTGAGAYFDFGKTTGSSLGTTGQTAAVTVEMWVNPKSFHKTSAVPWNILFTKWFNNTSRAGSAADQEFHYSLKYDGTNIRQNLYTTNCSNQYGSETFTATSALNKWYHLGFTVNSSGSLQFYLNGKPDGGAISGCGITIKNTSIAFVGDLIEAAGFDGSIAKIRFYNAALSASVIQGNYNSEAPLFASSPIYTLTYDYANATSGNSTATSDYTYGGTAITLPSPSRTGYTFNGWFDSSSGGTKIGDAGAAYTPTSNATLYGQWSGNSLTVTYDARSGTSIASGSTTSGGSISSSPGTPTRSGYSFDGWFTSASGGSAIAFPYTHNQTSSFTLYAQWTATAVTISTPSSGLNGTVGTSYSLSLSSGGGSGSGSYSIVTGSFPTGISLDTSTGVISGTPTLGGTFPLTIRFTDTNGLTATTSSFSILIAALKLSTPASLAVSTISGGGSAVTVTFNSVSNASSYKAQLYDSSANQIGSDYEGFTSGSTISGLTQGTSYSIKVFAVGDGTSYSNSDATSAATFTTPAAYYLTFAGSGSNYASVTGRTVIPSTGNFTAEAWISPTEYGSSRSAPVILSQGATGSRFYLKLNSSGYLIAFQEGGASEIQCSNAAIPLNIWTHVAIVKTSNTASCYVNGTLQTSNTPTSTLGSTAIGSGFFVGAYSASASASGTLFKGQIDEVKIWNTARTQTQINSNKEVAPLLSDTTLIAYFPLDATTGTTAIDMKDSANNLTLRTTMTWLPLVKTISYAAGSNGSGTTPSQSGSNDHSNNLTLKLAADATGITRSNYTISAWNTDTGGTSGTSYALGATYTGTADLTLYPTWLGATKTITYAAGTGGSGSAPSTPTSVAYGSTFTTPANTYSQTGYTFAGWSDGTNVYTAGATYPSSGTVTTNVTLTATWYLSSLAVTYDSNGGSSVASGSTVIGGSIATAPTPTTKSNYTFAGWSATNGGSAISFPYTHGNTSNFTLYARWTANVYTLTYFYNSATGGNTTETATATTGGSSITLPTPTRTGYTFAGWYSESAFTNSIGAAGATYMPTGSSLSPSAYAKWTAINYSVTYTTTSSTSGSSPTDTTNYNIGNSVVIKGNTGPLVRTGYSLAGWTAASDGSGTVLTSGSTFTVASANMTFYPKWSANTYTITYNKNGATGAPTAATASYTTAGTAVTLTTVGTMVKTGFDFGGWSTTPTGSALVGTYTTSADVTLYAVWTIKSISISFAKGDASSSTFFNFPAGRSANYGTTITLNDTVDSAVDISGVSNAFMGWNDGTSIYQSGATYLIGESAPTFTATWVKVFAVRYAFNGGTAAAGSSAVDAECLQAGTTCTDGQVITANAAPTRTGYTFAGWVDQNGVAVTAGGTFTVRSNRYLIYATWTAVDYSITYSTNGGSTAPTESTKQMGQTFVVASNPTKTGYNFTGWSDGSSVYGAGTTYYVGSSAVTLTAQWSPKVYTVIYDWNGGSGSTTNNDSFTVGTSAITLPVVGDHVKDGYTFSGWSETSDGSLISGGYTPTADKTLYAIWGTGSYTLTYDANGGTVGTSSTAVQNGSSLTLPTPTRSKFVFEGWFTASTGGTRIGSAAATYQPTQSRTVYAQWTQSSLYGLDPASLSRIGTTTASSGSNSTFTSSNANSSVSVTVPAGALPNGTNVYFDLVGDFSRAQSVLTGTNSYIISLVVSWLTSSGTVPDTAADKPISVTISNASIRSGMKVYGIVAGEVTLLGTATQDGTVTVSVYSDPEVVVVATKPGAPSSVAATSNATQQSVISWSAPTSDGGASITSYTATANTGANCTTTTTSCTITGLLDATSYTFTVTATNSLGTSDASSSASARTANAAVSGGSSNSGSSASDSPSRSNVTIASSVVVVGVQDAKVLSVEVTTPGATSSLKPASVTVDAKSKSFISDVKIIDGKLTLTPETGFSGKRVVTVTITENGAERLIQVPLTVLPEPVSKPVVTPASASKSIIRWTASTNAEEYTVFVDGVRVCVKASTSCSVSKLVGPSSLIEIVAKGGDRTYSEKVEANFQQTKAVLVSRLVNSATPKANLTRADQAALNKVIALVKEKGFGTIQISNITTNKKTESLAKARLAAIKKYLTEKSEIATLLVETIPATAKTYFNNISVKE